MKLKQPFHSSTGLERHFERLTHHWEARSGLGSKPFGPSGRYSAWLARACRCANLRQRHDLIKHHKPTHARIPLGAFGGFPFDADHCKVQLTILLEVQVVPAADVDPSALWRLFTPLLISLPMRLGAFALKQRPIFGWGSTLVRTHRNTVELAIAFEPDQDTVPPLMTRPQEL